MQEFGGTSGIALALIALLWVGLLVPGWVREHNERQLQRNAIRLQQTIRAMAATADQPEIVELEAKARTVRARQRELRRAEKLEVASQREQARLEAARREREALAAQERAAQELQEQELREETWRLAAQLRTAQLTAEREAAEAAMTDAQARREAAARARAAAQQAEELEARAAGLALSAQERWANGASGAERAVHRRITGEVIHPAGELAREAAARRRRGRLASTIVGLIGAALMVLTGAGLATGMVLGLAIACGVIGVVAFGGSLWMLQRINKVAAATVSAPQAESVTEVAVTPVVERAAFVVHHIEPMASPAVADTNSWTPVPVPAPLYLQRATADELEPPTPTDPDRPGREDQVDLDLAALLREEAEKSAEALRAMHREAEGAGFGGPARAEAGASRLDAITVGAGEWDRMGDVGALADELGASGDCADLDAVLRRRRAS